MKVAALCVSAWLLVLPFSFSDVARAEQAEEAEEAEKGRFYIGLYGGLAYPESLGDVTDQRTGSQSLDIPLSQFPHESDPIVGLKVGFNPDPQYTWFAVEGEFFVTDAETGSTAVLPSANIDVRALSLNILLRFLPDRPIYPYIGIGPSLIWAKSLQLEGRNKTITTLGLNLLAGVRLPIADRFMAFVEYKHNRSRLDFNLVNADFRLDAGVVGLAIMF